MTTKQKIFRVLYYFGLNGLFAACIYFGFFEGVSGAKNVALFIAWITSIFGVLILLAFWIDSLPQTENPGAFRERLARTHETVIPWPVDLTFDIIVTGVFIWFGHYILAVFYILSIFAGKAIRDLPKNLMLKKLKGAS